MAENSEVEFALLRQQVATLTVEINNMKVRHEKELKEVKDESCDRIGKVETNIKWGAFVVFGAVISQVLRVAGIS